jgi:hypothetical protein
LRSLTILLLTFPFPIAEPQQGTKKPRRSGAVGARHRDEWGRAYASYTGQAHRVHGAAAPPHDPTVVIMKTVPVAKGRTKKPRRSGAKSIPLRHWRRRVVSDSTERAAWGNRWRLS